MTAITTPRDGAIRVPTDLAATADRASRLAEGARAAATRRAYRSDWEHFDGWCAGHRLIARPATPGTVGLYLAAHEEMLAMATLTRRLSSIATAHRMAGHPMDTRHPAIRDVMRGLRRAKGTAQRHAEALTTPLTKQVVETCADRLIDRRDRALILIGFAGAFRRSELVVLDLDDLVVMPEGLRITIRKSKTDQDGEGEVIAVGRTGRDTCPVGAFQAWVSAAGIATGRAFRSVDRHGRIGVGLSTRAVAKIVQRRAGLAGLDAALFAGHSLRAGFATSAAAAGIEERIIAKVTRHRSTAVLRRYIRDGQLFDRNLAAEVGL
jgi:site-specific recombinase XerD